MQALWPVGAVAGLGAVDCAYLTYSKVTQVPLACPVEGGCTEVHRETGSDASSVLLARKTSHQHCASKGTFMCFVCASDNTFCA